MISTNYPLISVIVPVYKAEQYLHRCIDSILTQTFTDFELLLINDGSPDNSGIICDEYAKKDSRIRVFHTKNEGVSSARNLGLDNAKGKWITFCDSDDWVNDNWLELFQTNPNTDMTIQSYYVSKNSLDSEKFRQLKNSIYTKTNFNILFNELMDAQNCGFLWCRSFKNEIIQIHNLRFNPAYKICEDNDFIFTYLIYTKKINTINKGAYHYLEPDFKIKYKNSQSTQTNILLYENIINNIIELQGYKPNKILLHFVQGYIDCSIKIYITNKDKAQCKSYKQYIQPILSRSKLTNKLRFRYKVFLILPLNFTYIMLKLIHNIKTTKSNIVK